MSVGVSFTASTTTAGRSASLQSKSESFPVGPDVFSILCIATVNGLVVVAVVVGRTGPIVVSMDACPWTAGRSGPIDGPMDPLEGPMRLLVAVDASGTGVLVVIVEVAIAGGERGCDGDGPMIGPIRGLLVGLVVNDS